VSFDHAVTHVIEREGGYVNDPRDSGGETKYGISKAAFPSADIKNLTIADARDIYRRYYWEPLFNGHSQELPDPITFVMFDAAVNMGVHSAIKTAQQVCGLTIDGKFGPVTLAALKAQSPAHFVERFQAERICKYVTMGAWSVYGRGWARRAFAVAMEAMK